MITAEVLENPAYHRLSASAQSCYQILRLYRNKKTKRSWPSIGLIVTMTGLSRSSIKRGLRDLVAAGFIEKALALPGCTVKYVFPTEVVQKQTRSRSEPGSELAHQPGPEVNQEGGSELAHKKTIQKTNVKSKPSKSKASVLPSKSLRDKMVSQSAEDAKTRLADMSYDEFQTDGKINAWCGVAIWSDVYWSAGNQPVITNYGACGSQGKTLIQIARQLAGQLPTSDVIKTAVKYCQAAIQLSDSESDYPLKTRADATLGKIIAQNAVGLITAEMTNPTGTRTGTVEDYYKRKAQ